MIGLTGGSSIKLAFLSIWNVLECCLKLIELMKYFFSYRDQNSYTIPASPKTAKKWNSCAISTKTPGPCMTSSGAERVFQVFHIPK
jgi:hypothetical protein